MLSNAESPGRAGQGGSGDQSAAGVTPAPTEAKKTARPFGASASDAADDGIGNLSESSQKRFRDLVNARKEAEARAEAAERQLLEMQASSSQRGPIQRTSPDFQSQYDELRRLAVQSHDDPERLVGVLEQMASLKAGETVTSQLQQFFEEQRSREEQDRFRQETEKSFRLAVEKFPELKDENTEFYQLANQIYENSHLKNVPEGPMAASVMAWYARQEKKAGVRSNLETPSSRVPISSGEAEDVIQARKEALERHRQGDTQAIERFIGENFMKISRKADT